jgi:hypothetical protein
VLAILCQVLLDLKLAIMMAFQSAHLSDIDDSQRHSAQILIGNYDGACGEALGLMFKMLLSKRHRLRCWMLVDLYNSMLRSF